MRRQDPRFWRCSGRSGARPREHSVSSAPSASASPAPITLALVTSLTGPSAPETSSDPAGFLARIALQNAEGGVNGHKLVPLVIDDQTSPSEIVTGVQSALSKGAFGIVSASPLFFLAAKYPQQQGVPVTGSYTDGPEWGQQPYTNMFSSDLGSVDPSYPVNTLEGKILRQFGGTVLGSYGYSISPSSSREAGQEVKSFEHDGGKLGVLDTSVPFGGMDFTSAALAGEATACERAVPHDDRRLRLCPGHSSRAGGCEAEVSRLRHGLCAGRRQLSFVELLAGRRVLVHLPTLLPSRRGDGADGGCAPEVPALLENAVPNPVPVRDLGGCRPDDQGVADGGSQSRRGRL